MKRLLLVLTVSLTSLVSVPGGVSAVTYGDPVESPDVEFPEVVPIWVGGESLCTGTLIEQQVVLTAAHCVYGEPGPFQISVGAKTLNGGSVFDVDATWYHPRYDAAFKQNDIALLHLKTPANVARLGVLPSAKLKRLGNKFLIVGWGRDQNGLITGQLNRLSLNNQTIAAKRDFKGYFNPKTMVGAGRYFADEVLYGGGCTGDSGGPLYRGAAGTSRTVLGVTSFGARGCIDYKPTIFTRVDFYTPEIKKGIQLVKQRSINSPIPMGRATPAGVGPTRLKIGDIGPGGGIVFYVSPGTFSSPGTTCGTACKYLEAAPPGWSGGIPIDPAWLRPSHSSTKDPKFRHTGLSFPSGTPQFKGSQGVSICSGYQNSEDLSGLITYVTQNQEPSLTKQVQLVKKYNGGGKTDWFIPSKDELNELFKNKDIVGGFANDLSSISTYGISSQYRSSSNSGSFGVFFYSQNFVTGTSGIGTNIAWDYLYVRPIRAFG